MCHLKTITIRELHHNTGEWIRKAAKFGEIHVSERGKTIAKIVPHLKYHILHAESSARSFAK